jgi:signal transduction histidine kinase
MKGRRVLAILATVWPPLMADAAESAISRAPPVTITATRIEESTPRQLIGVRVITAEDIERSRASTLPELLQSLPGIRRRESPGTPNAQIDIRGFGSFGDQNTLVLRDGMRVREYEQLTANSAAIPLAAIDAERTRLLHDVHDGMGSHLITALRLARSEDVDRSVVSDTIEEGLQDLRLIIDSLDIGNQGLVQVLGNLRYRLEPRLAALGIRLEWDVQPRGELETVSPEVALAVLRIVQEALNNAVKHARFPVFAQPSCVERTYPFRGMCDAADLTTMSRMAYKPGVAT